MSWKLRIGASSAVVAILLVMAGPVSAQRRDCFDAEGRVIPCDGGGGGAAGVAGGAGGAGGAGAAGGAGGGPPVRDPGGTNNLLFQNRPLTLLQPLGNTTQYNAMPGIAIFFAYFNDIWPWVMGVAAGIAVLQALAAGIQIMISGSSEKAEEGKTRLEWALAGLLLIAFAGFILRMLNNVFFF